MNSCLPARVPLSSVQSLANVLNASCRASRQRPFPRLTRRPLKSRCPLRPFLKAAIAAWRELGTCQDLAPEDSSLGPGGKTTMRSDPSGQQQQVSHCCARLGQLHPASSKLSLLVEPRPSERLEGDIAGLPERQSPNCLKVRFSAENGCLRGVAAQMRNFPRECVLD